MRLLKWISIFLMIVAFGGLPVSSKDPVEGKQNPKRELSSTKDQEVISKLEKSLLSMFGLEEKPRIKGAVKVPPYMIHLYRMQERLNKLKQEQFEDELENGPKDERTTEKKITDDEESEEILIWGNTVRSYTHIEGIDDSFHPGNKMLFRFNVSGISNKESLQHAEMRIFHAIHPLAPSLLSTGGSIGLSKQEAEHLQRVLVFDVIRPARGLEEEIHQLLDTRVIDARTNSTISLDVSPALQRWLKNPQNNHGIYVEVLPLKQKAHNQYSGASHVRLRRSANTQPDSEEWIEEQPLLVVHMDDGTQTSRDKRNVPMATQYKKPLCRRHKLFVDFRKVEWNTWIVAPPGYDAYYCHGECPFPLSHHMNATNHAVIQNIIHSKYPSRVPSACCVPIKHSAISMLYLDTDKKVVLKTYQDMIVESCGCQ